MKKRYMVLSIILLTILLSACTGSHSAGTLNLEGATWVATDLNGVDPLDGRQPTLQFEVGQVSGDTGCNHYGGSYQIKDDTIRFEGLYSTEMACLDQEGLMEQEQVYLDLLRRANRFELVDGELIIFIDQTQVLRLSQE